MSSLDLSTTLLDAHVFCRSSIVSSIVLEERALAIQLEAAPQFAAGKATLTPRAWCPLRGSPRVLPERRLSLPSTEPPQRAWIEPPVARPSHNLGARLSPITRMVEGSNLPPIAGHATHAHRDACPRPPFETDPYCRPIVRARLDPIHGRVRHEARCSVAPLSRPTTCDSPTSRTSPSRTSPR